MGVVYLAHDEKLDRDVALKELAFPVGITPDTQVEMVARFQREARAAAKLQHPNIVGVFDTFSDADRHFIAMEYLDGAALSDLIDQGGLSTTAARSIALQTLDAVACAHRSGVVHRDIKPDNIFVLQDGRVKVADFGIAKVMSATGSGTVTQFGSIIGTPGYMSPEQVRGESVDGRSDIFSIGVVLYEMLTGCNPFLSDSPTTIMYRIVHEDPPALQVSRDPAASPLGAIVGKAIAKNPADRYQDADQMANDIRDGAAPAQLIAPTVPVSQRPPGIPRGPNRAVLVVGAVLVAATAAILFLALGGAGQPSQAGGATSPAPTAQTSEATEKPSPEATSPPAVPSPAPVSPSGVIGGTFTPGWTVVEASERDKGVALSKMRTLAGRGMAAAVIDTNYFKDEKGKSLTANYYAVVVGSYGLRTAANSAAKRYGGYPRYAVPK
jgi:serine/threonine-protein kinase